MIGFEELKESDQALLRRLFPETVIPDEDDEEETIEDPVLSLKNSLESADTCDACWSVIEVSFFKYC